MNSLVSKVFAIGLVVLLAVVVPALSVYQIELVTQMLIYAIFAMSLDILLGYTGLPSLGHAAYFGLAAYTTAVLSLRLHVPFALAAPAGIAASVVAAALFNLLALRTSRGYYLMITLALSQLLWSLAVSWTELTGGDNGLPGLERPQPSWLPLPLASATGFFYLTLLFFIGSAIALGARALAGRICAQGRARERSAHARARIRRLAV